MKEKVNIVVIVDVIGALSDGSLLNGNLSLVDDGSFDSTGQGTPELCTVVQPGQVVEWSALAIDLQTPVEIKNVTFLGAAEEPPDAAGSPADDGRLDLNVWSGVVPCMAPGIPFPYRLELQMYEGGHSVLGVESPALMCR
ncbi:hypothetical protein [Streptomyces sp. NBC_01190]|uniref:hypothetical protein n=1 Tax=Streptomyces sp. NBC_01190 TaxID=2903767 RepID=UPI00386C272C|nr:hypothetical protein OG519_06025 [Streptomyces sp. NBC_01190]